MTALVAPPRADAARAPTDTGQPPVVGRTPWPLLAGIVAAGGVLRILWATSHGLSFDEAFTAMAGRRSVGGLFSYLRTVDSHPPLDYLIRMPFAHAGAGDLLLRTPSLVFSIGALALVAVWMRDRGGIGLLATALMAASAFQVSYGGEARMYALLELLGVAAAMLAERWYRSPRPWHAAAACMLVFLAVADHASGYLLCAGLVVLAGWRRDREAWRWRVGAVGGVVLWAPLWGPSMVTQLQGQHSSWVEPTTWSRVVDTVASTVTFQDHVSVVIALAVFAGAITWWRRDRSLAHVGLALGVLPFAMAAAIGIFTPFFLNRTVTLAAWAPVVAVAYCIDAVFRRSQLIGVAAVVATAMLVLPATLLVIDEVPEYDVSSAHVVSVARPGDTVAVVPGWYGPLIDWRVGVRSGHGADGAPPTGIDGARAIVLRGHAPTGRTWVVSFTGLRETYPGFQRCAPDWTDDVITVSCLRNHAR
jgi:hypothetical protein